MKKHVIIITLVIISILRVDSINAKVTNVYNIPDRLTSTFVSTDKLQDEYNIVLHKFENPVTNCIWDGKQYIISTRAESKYPDKKTIKASYDGANWEDIDRIICISDLIYGTSGYTVLQTLVGTNSDEVSTMTGNVLSLSNGAQYKISVWHSGDGKQWNAISGYSDFSIGWEPEQKLFLKDDKVIGFISGYYVASADGKIFHQYEKTKSDPYGLTPNEYIYLGKNHGGGDYVFYDGSVFLASTADYFGKMIERSEDGINWDIVSYDAWEENEKRKVSYQNDQIFTHDDRYYILGHNDSIYVSDDSINWKKMNIEGTVFEETIRLMNVEKIEYSSFEKAVFHPYIYNYNDSLIITPRKVDISDPFYRGNPKCYELYYAKNFMQYSQLEFDNPIGKLLYIDDKVIITEKYVLNHENIRYLANSPNSKYVSYAFKLKDMGLFNGNNEDFMLAKQPNRIEVAVMLVRLLGKEELALAQKYEHPFSDVPSWANDYVGYLYHIGMTNGISELNYGSYDLVNGYQYLTFMLRILGYDDAKGDFTWDNSIDYAFNKGLINQKDYNELKENVFLRDHLVKYSFKIIEIKKN